MGHADLPGVVALQKLAFPPPFPQDYHWDAEHLERHIELFPEGQWVMVTPEETVVGSCSNTLVANARWDAHLDWYSTVGGPALRDFSWDNETLYGLDIAVDPTYRRQGIGRRFYEARFDLIRAHGLTRYGTGCRMPDFLATATQNPELDVHRYGAKVAAGELSDRTLTPLLRMGLTFLGVVEDYMTDKESNNAAALLEWKP